MGNSGWLAVCAALTLAAFWPQGARAADDPNMGYLVQQAFADNCKQTLPALSKLIDSSLAASQSRLPQERLAAAREYARSAAGKRAAQAVGIAITAASNDNKLIASYECSKKINEWGQPAYPQVSGSQIGPDASRSLVSSIAPLALARLDCQVLDSVAAKEIAMPMAVDAGKSVPAEQWTFSGCGRTHSVSIDRREGRYGLAAQDRFDLAGM